MKNIAIVAVAGIATASGAQSVTLDFDVDGIVGNNAVVNSSSGNWTVTASFTGFPDPTAYFGGYVGEWHAAGDGIVVESSLEPLMRGIATWPYAIDASIFNINMFNSALLQTNDSSNPLAIFTFDTTGTTTSLTYVSAVGVASVFTNSNIFGLPVEFVSSQINITSDTLVPAPGVLALLGLGGLAAARRRR